MVNNGEEGSLMINYDEQRYGTFINARNGFSDFGFKPMLTKNTSLLSFNLKNSFTSVLLLFLLLNRLTDDDVEESSLWSRLAFLIFSLFSAFLNLFMAKCSSWAAFTNFFVFITHELSTGHSLSDLLLNFFN